MAGTRKEIPPEKIEAHWKSGQPKESIFSSIGFATPEYLPGKPGTTPSFFGTGWPRILCSINGKWKRDAEYKLPIKLSFSFRLLLESLWNNYGANYEVMNPNIAVNICQVKPYRFIAFHTRGKNMIHAMFTECTAQWSKVSLRLFWMYVWYYSVHIYSFLVNFM